MSGHSFNGYNGKGGRLPRSSGLAMRGCAADLRAKTPTIPSVRQHVTCLPPIHSLDFQLMKFNLRKSYLKIFLICTFVNARVDRKSYQQGRSLGLKLTK
jgi:hypothetical protein